MVSLNRAIIAGRLTRDPKLRKTPSGVSVTDLLIALNRDYQKSDGSKHQEVCFVDVVVWGALAELCVENLECSSSVLVEGHLQLDSWYGKDGEKRCKLRVAAERVQFLESAMNRKRVSTSQA